jgi:hypothetical protein
MTSAPPVFLLDSSVLIAAHRSYYAFDICPGFWKSVKAGYQAGRIFSTQRVRAEIVGNDDALARWVRDELHPGFFISDSTSAVSSSYGPMMAWVVAKGFLPAAQAKFASDADGWLVATAKHNGYCLVTHETPKPEAKAIVPIPNVCEEFGVPYCNSFDMLRELGCRFE